MDGPEECGPTQSAERARVLCLADKLDGGTFFSKLLDQAGIKCDLEIAGSPQEFADYLRRSRYDMVLADLHPNWSALDALETLQHLCANLPFLVVADPADEEMAVECLKKGAADYVLKDRLARLPFAVKRALNRKVSCNESRSAGRY